MTLVVSENTGGSWAVAFQTKAGAAIDLTGYTIEAKILAADTEAELAPADGGLTTAVGGTGNATLTWTLNDGHGLAAGVYHVQTRYHTGDGNWLDLHKGQLSIGSKAWCSYHKTLCAYDGSVATDVVVALQGPVNSVNGKTGAVVLDADDLDDSATAHKFASAAQLQKVDRITVTQPVDLDTMEARVNQLDAAVVLKGGWDASAGTFPGSGTAQAGDSYQVTVAGTVDGVAFSINDRLIAITDNASTGTYTGNWLKADYSDLVQSVNGQTGAVVLPSPLLPSGIGSIVHNDAVGDLWILPWHCTGYLSSTATFDTTTWRYKIPVYVSKQFTCALTRICVQQAGGAGAKIRWGLRRWDRDEGLSGFRELLWDTGQVDVDTTGFKDVIISDVEVPPGWYVFEAVTNDTSVRYFASNYLGDHGVPVFGFYQLGSTWGNVHLALTPDAIGTDSLVSGLPADDTGIVAQKVSWSVSMVAIGMKA